MLRRCRQILDVIPEPSKRKFRAMKNYGAEFEDAKKSSHSFFSGFLSVSLISLGLTFTFVPLYRLYCSVGGRGFDARFFDSGEKKEEENNGVPEQKKILTVHFQGDAGSALPITFVPLQRKIEALVGEPTLAFFCAYNKSKRTLLGVSTYNISPPETTNYLNKIQCFCFEEQRFKPNELVEMPVFFYIHRDFLKDPILANVHSLILSYTFFSLERTKQLIEKF